jgi:hypothetical protein
MCMLYVSYIKRTMFKGNSSHIPASLMSWNFGLKHPIQSLPLTCIISYISGTWNVWGTYRLSSWETTSYPNGLHSFIYSFFLSFFLYFVRSFTPSLFWKKGLQPLPKSICQTVLYSASLNLRCPFLPTNSSNNYTRLLRSFCCHCPSIFLQ